MVTVHDKNLSFRPSHDGRISEWQLHQGGYEIANQIYYGIVLVQLFVGADC